jgi:regulator of ribosome biosynthesis
MQLKTASWLSGVSTASMGKFDRRLPGEKEGGRKLPGKRRKFIGVTDAASERALMSKTADRLLRERADDVLDIHKAIGKLEAAARGERHAAKAAGGGGGGGGGGGSGGGGGKKKGGSSKGGSSKGGSSKGGRDGRRAAGAGGRSGGKQLGGGVSKKGGKRGGK